MKYFSRAIRIARAARNLSQKDLAERADLTPSFVSLLERGSRKPSIETINAIARALDVPPHLLTLLASDSKALAGVNKRQAGDIGLQLLELLLAAREGSRK